MNTTLPPETTMYTALLEKHTAFERAFVAAIKTTGIFSRPTCTAKKPRPENVEYFARARDALALGYRPCRVCRPMERARDAPPWLELLLKEVAGDPARRWTDADLRARDVDPARVRRWFKQHHGMTFQAYLRALRINRAFGLIRHNSGVTDAAFESGFESLSAFHEAFKNLAGFAPSHSATASVVTINRILSPLGPMLAGASDRGLCLLEFIDRRMLETQIKRLRAHLGASFLPGEHPLFTAVQGQLDAYFDGELKEFDIPLDLRGTPFQESVWTVLRQIPYGVTRSYLDQAIALGSPKAVRAVASANGDNRILRGPDYAATHAVRPLA